MSRNYSSKAQFKPSYYDEKTYSEFVEAESRLFAASNAILQLLVISGGVGLKSSIELSINIGGKHYQIVVMPITDKAIPYGLGPNTQSPMMSLNGATFIHIAVNNLYTGEFPMPSMPGDLECHYFTQHGEQLFMRGFSSIDEDGTPFNPSAEQCTESDIYNQTRALGLVADALELMIKNIKLDA